MTHPDLLTCLICGSPDHEVVFREFGVDVLRCRNCHHIYSSWKSKEHYDGYWGEEILDPGAFYWDEAHGPMYQDFFRLYLVPRPPGSLLDVGAGLGYFVRKVQSQFPSWESHGSEISPVACAFAEEKLGVTHMVPGRLEDGPWEDASFDVITLWDVIEHIKEPDPLLRTVFRLLKPGGICFLHTPNAPLQLAKARLKRLTKGIREGIHYLEARDHLHLYSYQNLKRLLERCEFSEVEVTHLHPIQSVAGSRSRLLRLAKNLWFHGARLLWFLSFGWVNLDNLFLVARRPEASR
jgi:2-polyprenyl-3-methyl-5-hydroxy-6-metoxy-1,4-benzoquinol methylase